MKFRVLYQVGESVREKIIICNNLDEAEVIANKRFKSWIDIFYVDYSNAKSYY